MYYPKPLKTPNFGDKIKKGDKVVWNYETGKWNIISGSTPSFLTKPIVASSTVNVDNNSGENESTQKELTPLGKFKCENGCPKAGRGFTRAGNEKYDKWYNELPQEKKDELAILQENEMKEEAAKKERKAEKKKTTEWKRFEVHLKRFPSEGSTEDKISWCEELLRDNKNSKILRPKEIQDNSTKFNEFILVSNPEYRDGQYYGTPVFCGTLSCKEPILIMKGEDIIFLDESQIEIVPADGEEAERLFEKTIGVAYYFTAVIDGIEYLVKTGSTTTTMADRIQSYDCGNIRNRLNGTCSTTNYRYKQTMAIGGIEFRLYIVDCSKYNSKLCVGSLTTSETASGLPRQYEELTNLAYNAQYGKKIIGNIQTEKNDHRNDD